MTDDQIKEQMSRGFVRLVANRAGYKCTTPETDHGVDLIMAEVRIQTSSTGTNRYRETGRYVDLQLKCTCEASITRTATSIKFDLEAKTYDDLVHRLSDPNAVPLVLVLFVMPDDADTWLSVGPVETVLRGIGYFWRPEVAAVPTSNTSTKRIEIPLANIATGDFATQVYGECHS